MKNATLLGDWMQLIKPRIIQLNLVAAFGGYWLASKWVVDFGLLCWMLLGTTLTMASSCIFNNVWDYKLDRKMARTCNRPLATGRIKLTHAVWCAVALGISGEVILFLNVNKVAGWLGLLGMFFYIVIYTMWLKRNSTWSTAVGGVSGAVPPVNRILCRHGNRGYRSCSVILLAVPVAARAFLVAGHPAGGGVQSGRVSIAACP